MACGLAVDLHRIPEFTTGNGIAPIECVDNVDFRPLRLLQNGTLQFKSRIINGTFTRGYCMRIQRGSIASHGYENLENYQLGILTRTEHNI